MAHSCNVLAVARLLFDRLPLPVTERDAGLLKDLEAAAMVHDIGKAAVGFQEVLEGKRRDWNGWRHEILSAAFASNLPLREEVIFAVLTHHKQIPGRPVGESRNRLHWSAAGPEDWVRLLQEWVPNESLALDLWKQLCSMAKRPDLELGNPAPDMRIALDQAWLDRDLKRRQLKQIPSGKRIRASLLRGLLMGADHLASARKQDIPPAFPLANFKPKFTLRTFQEKCRVKGNVILDAPTGSGKTEAAIVWAAENQCPNGRFFYTLPYTAALNAMHGRLSEDFPGDVASIGLLHGNAAHHLYKAAQDDYPSDPQKATQEALARARLARETFFPVRVCTPHQLLRFTLRGRGWEQMLSEIPGSCIVFDEVHSYDAKLAGLTLGTARLFASMGANLMFISATLPAFMREHIKQIAPMLSISPDPDSETDREVLDRRRHYVSLHEGSLLDLIDPMLRAVEAGKHVLVVCNHVASAQKVASILRTSLGDEEGLICLFHGRFNMRDRKEKEARLRSKSLPSVLVATQVVEVSLDISFDMGYFEAAPLDALVQRMGRVNRQGKVPCPIVIAKEALSRHAIYDGHRTATTLDLLGQRSEPLSERDLTGMCDQVYEGGYSEGEKEDFEQRLTHKFFTAFEQEAVAGEHQNWIETVIERQDGRADVLPIGLKAEYDALVDEKLWLKADALLVNTYTSRLGTALDKNTEPWTVNLKYDRDGLHSRKSS